MTAHQVDKPYNVIEYVAVVYDYFSLSLSLSLSLSPPSLSLSLSQFQVFWCGVHHGEVLSSCEMVVQKVILFLVICIKCNSFNARIINLSVTYTTYVIIVCFIV